MDLHKRTVIHSHKISIRARYVETDRAGVVHHSVYPIWFEMGRTELLRAAGLAYKDLEAAGIFFVVVELFVKYHRPAGYDEKLELLTTCSEVTACKIKHAYQLTRCCDRVLLAEGWSTLACVDAKGKIRRIPEGLGPK